MTSPAHLIILLIITGFVVAGLQLSPDVMEEEKYVNDSFMLTCHGKGAEGTTWKGPDQKIISSNKGRVHVEERSSGDNRMAVLVFEKIERDDRGLYICQSTVNGDSEQLTFKLSVVKPIKIEAQEEQNATEFQNTLVKCEVIGDPSPSVIWHFQGDNLQGPRYQTMPMGLRIANVSKADGGNYSCRAFQITSRTSNIKAASIKLNILHGPSWKNKNKADKDLAYGYEGGLVNLTCEAEAQPPATFNWFRSNRTINFNSVNYSIISEPHRSVLQFTLSSNHQLGEYECEAENPLGKLRKTISLQKGVKPIEPSRVSVVNIGAHSAQLEIVTHSKDDVVLGYRVQFLKKTPNIPLSWDHPEYQDLFKEEKESSYTLKDLTADTEYILRVATRNAAGLSDYSSEYYIQTRSSGMKLYGSPSLISLAVFVCFSYFT